MTAKSNNARPVPSDPARVEPVEALLACASSLNTEAMILANAAEYRGRDSSSALQQAAKRTAQRLAALATRMQNAAARRGCLATRHTAEEALDWDLR